MPPVDRCPPSPPAPSASPAPPSAYCLRSEEAAEAFFRAALPLCARDCIIVSLNDFVARHSAGSGGAGGPAGAIYITSGGTSVPLEQRCMRYIDNFASGQRGTAATDGSKQPYCRFLPEDSSLDLFELGENSEIQDSSKDDGFPYIQGCSLVFTGQIYQPKM